MERKQTEPKIDDPTLKHRFKYLMASEVEAPTYFFYFRLHLDKTDSKLCVRCSCRQWPRLLQSE
jgi:hypothetical protein